MQTRPDPPPGEFGAPGAGAAVEPGAPVPAERARAGRTARDMILSLVVLLIPVLVIVAIFRFSGGEKPTQVDPSAAIAQARSAQAFPVLAPPRLPDGWRSVSAQFHRQDAASALRIGFVTSSGGALQLIETNEPITTVVDRELGARVRPLGPVSLAGRSWQSYEVRDGERALVLAEPDRTVIVIGRGEPGELATLATALA